MKRPNNLTISLPQDRLEQLEKLSKQGESIGQCAKRLLLELLDGKDSLNPDEAKELRERIEAIEKKLGESPVTHSTLNGSPQSIALDPGDREKWVICLVEDGQPRQFWDGQGWTDQIGEANRYQSETSLRRTLEKLKTRKRERPDWDLRYNSIANLEKILGDKK
jgi:hypothetical protein